MSHHPHSRPISAATAITTDTQVTTPSSVRTASTIAVMGTSDTTRTMRRAVTSRGDTGTQ